MYTTKQDDGAYCAACMSRLSIGCIHHVSKLRDACYLPHIHLLESTNVLCMFCIQEQLVFLQYNASRQLFSRPVQHSMCRCRTINPCSSLG